MAKKKALSLPVSCRRNWVETSTDYSIRRQCRLTGLSRSGFYYEPVLESEENLHLMHLIDAQYMKNPEFGYPRMTDWLIDERYDVNPKRIARLMQIMGLQAITPGPHTSKPCPGHEIYPYLLRGVEIMRPNHVWSTDITYIPMASGFLYLVAVIDWYSRYVISWELSNSMDTSFCITALNRALESGVPDIFNTDQGGQFTSSDFTNILLDKKISISMDGRGRALDNVFIERLWWTVKYENVYPRNYETGKALFHGLDTYFRYYNEERKHSSLDKKTPAAIFFQKEIN